MTTYETLTVMILFGTFIVGLLSLIIVVIKAIIKK